MEILEKLALELEDIPTALLALGSLLLLAVLASLFLVLVLAVKGVFSGEKARGPAAVLARLDSILKLVEEAIVAFGIAAVSVILFVNVVLRFGFNSGWEWAEEVARYSIVWIVFIGGSICARKGMHLAVDALAVRLGPRGRLLLRLAVDNLCIAFCVYLILWGYKMVALARDTEQMTAALGMPIYYVYLAIPIGGALMAVRFSQSACLALFGRDGIIPQQPGER